jgi:hypothetical protein
MRTWGRDIRTITRSKGSRDGADRARVQAVDAFSLVLSPPPACPLTATPPATLVHQHQEWRPLSHVTKSLVTNSNPETQNSLQDDLLEAVLPGSGGRIRTYDLWVMSSPRVVSPIPTGVIRTGQYDCWHLCRPLCLSRRTWSRRVSLPPPLPSTVATPPVCSRPGRSPRSGRRGQDDHLR